MSAYNVGRADARYFVALRRMTRRQLGCAGEVVFGVNEESGRLIGILQSRKQVVTLDCLVRVDFGPQSTLYGREIQEAILKTGRELAEEQYFSTRIAAKKKLDELSVPENCEVVLMPMIEIGDSGVHFLLTIPQEVWQQGLDTLGAQPRCYVC